MYMHTYIDDRHSCGYAVAVVALSKSVTCPKTVWIFPLAPVRSAELHSRHTGSISSSIFVNPSTTMRVTLCTADGNTAEVEVALETDISTIKLLAEIELGLMNPDSLQVSHNGTVIAGNPTLQAVGVEDHDLLMLAVPEPVATATAPAVLCYVLACS
eukprot:6290-Heterococcus_DN1.PRE.2